MVVSIVLVPAAYIAGAFTPAVGRKIKALFVKETTAVKADVTADLAAAVKKL